ncbi:MAG: flagellar hook-associated protein FlgK [Gammaproteobacteria bacterium]|nr:flagellar hook-associated protein FlgK [Gammaproteobacteria bacterium]
MASLLGTGVSALQAFQQSLATTSHNIANVNTDGYSRQRVEVTERPPEFSGAGFIGQGVDATGVTRIYDQFLVDQVVSNTSSQGQFDVFFGLASQLDNLLANEDSGLSARLQDFFNATQDVADDPVSIPARTVLLGEAESLVDRFAFYEQRLSDLKGQVNTDIENEVTVINGLSQAIADLNLSILRSGGAASNGADGKLPNDLLDQRDQLVLELSKIVSISTLEQGDGSLSVFVGGGQSLVVGTTVQDLAVTRDAFDPSVVNIVLQSGNSQVDVTSQIVGGSLGGSLDFSSRMLDSAERELGRIAIGLTDAFNQQHRLGMDLDSVLGESFFTGLNTGSFTPTVFSSTNNAGSAIVTASYGTVADLTVSDYDLRYTGGTSYTLTRLTDGQIFSVDTAVPASLTNDGFTLSIGAGAAVGDLFRIQPTADGSRDIGLAITDPRKIAAAVPVRTETSLQNTGTATIDSGVVTDRATFVSDTYTIRIADNANATANGVVGTITDAGPTANTLEYRLSINGVQVYSQNEASAVLANLTALAAEINDDVGTTGVRAYVDTVNNRMYLLNDPSTSSPITVTETLTDTPAGAPFMDVGDTVTGYFGSVLAGTNFVDAVSNTITIGNTGTDYIVIDSGGNNETSGTYISGNNITFNGIQTSITGAASWGDVFTLRSNNNGVSDNRNMLALSGVQQQQVLAGGTSTLGETFGQLISSIGTTTRQSEITLDAQTVLLNQSIAARASVSGVNLDEEAANLILYQQAYQAAAQVISIADNLFQTLINAI